MKIDSLAVIGLGYVGLPLAIAMAAAGRRVTGFDIDTGRIDELGAGEDRSGEVTAAALNETAAIFTADPAALQDHDVYVITVPTPVDAARKPDLGAVEAACRTVGKALGRDAIVVLESTVYPGTVEDVCGPILAAESGLIAGADFWLGYSPERINPGDPDHGLENITKVVAGQTAPVTAALCALYGVRTPEQ